MVENIERKYGLLGKGISYSLSPKIHLAAAEELGLPIKYEIFDFPPEEMQSFLSEASSAGISGFNVTVPYKQEVAKFFDSELDSVNTVKFDQDKPIVTSTDGPGFYRGLKRLVNWPDKVDAFIFLGFGGAVQGILEFLLTEKLNSKLHVLRRTPRETEKKWQARGVQFDVFKPESLTATSLKYDKVLIVQGTDAPRKGHDLYEFIPCFEEAKSFQYLAFSDLMYGTTSSILDYCKNNNIPCQDGLPMLIEQARLAQEIWWGKSGTYENIESKLLK